MAFIVVWTVVEILGTKCLGIMCDNCFWPDDVTFEDEELASLGLRGSRIWPNPGQPTRVAQPWKGSLPHRGALLPHRTPPSYWQWHRKWGIFLEANTEFRDALRISYLEKIMTRARHRKSISPTIWWWLSMLPRTPGIKFLYNSDAIPDLKASP